MRYLYFVICCFGIAATGIAEPTKRPNILLVVSDDVGFSDTQPFGGEAKMPALQQLAAEGVMYTNFHAAPSCSVTRSMLLTGAYSHEVGMGTFDYAVYPDAVGKPGYEGYLNDRAVTVATLLRDAGYNTMMAGKWHLGKKEKKMYPPARGFMESYGVLSGGSHHYTRERMMPLPVEEGMPPKTIEPTYRNGVQVEDAFVGTFSDDVYTQQIIEMMQKHESDGKPFFAYLALTAPHFPLQAPKQKIEKYAATYSEGWDVLRQRRFERMKQLGVIDSAARLSTRNRYVQAWDTLTKEQQLWNAKKQSIVAAMLEKTDDNIAKLVEYLKASGQYDNTFIIYLSDNGADALDVLGDNSSEALTQWIKHHYDNSYENLGNPDSNVSLGQGWASAGVGGLSWYKLWNGEGGIRVPLIVKPHNQVKVASLLGGKEAGLTQVRDIANTILDLANVPAPQGEYKGRSVATAKGTSLLSHLRGESSQVHPDDEAIAFELFGSGVLFMGNYKIIRTSEGNGGDNQWHMYNLTIDPCETTPLEGEEPKRFRVMMAAYEKYAEDYGVIAVDPAWNVGRSIK
ncbi:arylsulfatase [Rubritalea marina]|uniref:arylsulfatase n=1 Tax=Rubritalea marina TaxID=361055 RepID=UPI0003A8E414|nr:arylsulfatase [Rubritalea marina]